MQPLERRRYQRVRKAGKVTYTGVEFPDNLGQPREGSLKNVSASGVSITASECPSIGKYLRVTVEMPRMSWEDKGTEKISFVGQVKSVLPSMGKSYSLGLSVISISPREKKMLNTFAGKIAS